MIIRTPKKTHFTVLNNTLIDDARLSWAALGMLVYLLSKPDNWRVLPAQLIRLRNTGRDGVYALLKELAAAGYVRKEQVRNHAGRITGTDWYVFDEPHAPSTPTATGAPESAHPDTASPDPAMPDEAVPYPAQPDGLVKTESLAKTESLVNTDFLPTTETTPPAPRATPTTDDTKAVEERIRKKPNPTQRQRITPYPIPGDWQPADACLRRLEQAGIPTAFALSLMDEFVLYWQGRGEPRPGWDSTFLTHVQRHWQHRPTPALDGEDDTAQRLLASEHRLPGRYCASRAPCAAREVVRLSRGLWQWIINPTTTSNLIQTIT